MKSLKFIILSLSLAIVLGYSAPSNAAKIILYSWSEVSAFCGEAKYNCTSIVETRDNGEEFWVIYDEYETGPNNPPPGRGD
jgi:hypothetical protein